MKNLTNSKLFSTALFLLSILVLSKVIWMVISLLFLPKSGIEHTQKVEMKPLYYPIKLANKSPIVTPPPPPVQVKPKTVGNMQGYTLLAIYNAPDMLVVTVTKGSKSKVLAKGEAMDGFVLKSAGSNYAIFTKGAKEFELLLKGAKTKTANTANSKTLHTTPKTPKAKKEIVEADDGVSKIVSKGLLSAYTKDIDKVWKDIGIADYKVNGRLQGFKVNFIKKGSDFEKLGLQKGDILTAVNGQELDSYNAAFGFFKEIESIENLTLNIKRNNQEMELEYEIQ